MINIVKQRIIYIIRVFDWRFKTKSKEVVLISLVVILASVVVIQFTVGNAFKQNPSSPPIIQTQEQQPPITTTQTSIKPTSQLNFTSADTSNRPNSSSSLTAIFKQVQNSVVQITSKVTSVNEYIIINGNPLQSQSTKLGSGFVYNSDGYIITNNHVVEGSKTVDVTFVDGNTYTAKVVGTDPYSDMAVLKIDDDLGEEKIIPIPLGDSSRLEVGEQVIAIGNPYGLSDTMTTGIVSQVGRLLPNQEMGFSIPNVIQTDAAINPGNSGGPLLNMEGQVIGINSAIKSSSGDFAGIGFAIPSSTIQRIAPQLIQKGSYSHPWLGISGASLTPDLARDIGLQKNFKGVLVSSVVKGGAAEKAGLKGSTVDENSKPHGGDIITAIDGHAVKRIEDVIFYIEEHKSVGDKVVLTVNRGDKVIELDAVLQARPTSTS